MFCRAYLITVGTLLAVAFLLPVFPCRSMDPTRWKNIKIAALVLPVVFCIVPLSHFAAIGSAEEKSLVFRWVAAVLSCYTTGFAFYMGKFPERWAPGRFDYGLFSHNWWHFLVFAAVVVWYFFLGEAVHLRLNTACPAV